MLFGLLKNKKVKPAKVKKEGYDAMLPKDYLFWGKRFVEAKEDGIDFCYEERECFLGNTSESRVSNGETGDAFAMRVLTGMHEGRVYFPQFKNGEFVIEIPSGSGTIEYELEIEDFKLGDRTAEYYQVGELVVSAKTQNDAERQKQKNIAEARKISLMQ